MDLQRPRKLVTRGIAAVAGAAIIYHEVVLVDSAEPLLVVLGLWFLGIPPALFLDGLRRVTDAANSAVDEVTSRVEGAVTGAVEAPARRRDDSAPEEAS